MFGSNLLKHLKEFQRYVRNFQYEMGDGGIYFPKALATAGGIYDHDVNGEDRRIDHNIIPDEGLNHILDVIMLDTLSAAPWYCMLHSGTGTPVAGTTLANYHSQLVEITSGTDGYTEATRVLWVGDAIDTGNTEVTNTTTPATFTIATTGGNLAVNGAGLCSVSAKGNYVGTLLSAGKFSAERSLADTDVFNLRYKVDLDAV